MRATSPFFVAGILLAPSPAWGAVQVDGQGSRASVARLAPGRTIHLDGRVNAEEWQGAGQLSPLTQVRPVEGAQPTYPTQVSFFQDGETLFIGIVCFDDPKEVRARQMDRDAFVRYDDVVELWFDTFHDHQSAYWFQITAGGSRGDALIANGGTSFNKRWDGVWEGKSRVTGRGWEAEIALPFQTLAFDSSKSRWGFNLRRKRVANGEESRWSGAYEGNRFFLLTAGGVLGGLQNLDQGLGLEVVPYLRGDLMVPYRAGGHTTNGSLAMGGDVSLRPTPESNLRITLATDFAETEVDERRINLTRFPLFFPEKRGFFLEDAGIFEFGAPGNRRGLVPFFSRTIGRNKIGQPVPITGGAKYSARLGDWNVGLLDVLVEDWGEGYDVPQKNFSVARVTRRMGEESSVGVIATHGLADARGTSTTLGLDMRLSDGEFLGQGRPAALWAYGLFSENKEQGQEASNGGALGLEGTLRTREWRHELQVNRVDQDFDPALGFVRRTGILDMGWESEFKRQWGDQAWVRSVEAEIGLDVTRDLEGTEDEWRLPLRPLGLEFQSQDELQYEVTQSVQTIADPFELTPGVFVAAGRHEMTRHSLSFESNDRRDYGGELEVEWGDFYGGHLVEWSVSTLVVPGPHFALGLGWTDAIGRIPAGEFHTQAASVELDFSFSPDISWKNLVQYDTESEDLGFQSRLRWILAPGQNLFLVGQGGWTRQGLDRFERREQALSVKLSWSLRF
ncbi:MAG TPA: hypothetical protein EYQ25_14825 [Planctomycetes bacterium]|nr:hypothetical protein [Planctomycetota bacterium]HIL37577.1 hypothetical protein [Planctomycetota bacterium]